MMLRPSRRAGRTPGVGDAPRLIAALTGIRAVAAGWVVLYHLRDLLVTLLPATRVLQPWMTCGFLGVDVFFVLSGFVISHNYADRLSGHGRRRRTDFLAARFARLYPVHAVMLLVCTGLIALWAARGGVLFPEQHRTVPGLVGNVFLLQALPGVEPWNGPSWSISCEAAAYLVFPFAAARLMRLRGRTAGLLAVLVAIGTVVAVTAVTVMVGSSTIPLYWIRIAGEFSLGCLLWAAWRRGGSRSRRWDAVALGAVGLVMALLWFGAAYGAYWGTIPLLALAVVATAGSCGPVRAVLTSRIMQWGGRVSYSLYMVHLPAIIVLYMFVPAHLLTTAPLAVRTGAVAVYVGGTLLAAACLYHGVEEPARRWLRRRLGGSTALGDVPQVDAPADPGQQPETARGPSDHSHTVGPRT